MTQTTKNKKTNKLKENRNSFSIWKLLFSESGYENQVNKIYYFIIFILYLFITLYAVLNHEPWRDEAQSWLIARDANFFDIFKLLPFEKAPALWYLILLPLAKSGMPENTILMRLMKCI